MTDKHHDEAGAGAGAGAARELVEKIVAHGIAAKDLGLGVGKSDKSERGRKPAGLTQQLAEGGASDVTGGE